MSRTRFVELLGELPVEAAAHGGVRGIGAVAGLGRELALSAYDAAYVHLARRERVPLATRDRQVRAVLARAGVAFYDAA